MNGKKFFSWMKNSSGEIFLFVAAVILLNLVCQRIFFRIDITAEKSYSISEASRRVVKNLEEPLSVKVFFSQNLPSPYSATEQYVKDILVEYKNSANRNFSYEFFDADKYENQKIARAFGLNQTQIQEVKNNEVGLKNVFMGIVLTYADQIEKLDGIFSSDGLEYKLTSAMGKIISQTNILAGLDGEISVTLFKSESLGEFQISSFDKIDSQVQKSFDAANKKFQNRLVLKKENPSTEQAEDSGKKFGVQVVSWQNENGGTEKGAIGLVVQYGEKFKNVPLEMQRSIFGYGISGLDDLDENIAECVKSVVAKNSVVAYITGHGENSAEDESESENFSAVLSDTYELKNVNLAEEEIPFAAASVIVNGAKDSFSDEELYKIDQFVLRGGNVIFFADSFSEIMPNQNAYYQQPVYLKNETGLEKLFSAWGIKIGDEYVLDKNCFTQNSRQYGKLNFFYVPLLAKKSLNQKIPLSKNLGDVFFKNAFAIDTTEAEKNPDAKISVIAKTSPESWTVPVTENFLLSPLALFPPAEEEKFSAQNVAVLLEGKFKSAFEIPPKKNDEKKSLETQNHLAQSSQPGKIFIASTSAITTYELLKKNSAEPVEIFVRNAVDYMSGNEELCAMRTKNLSLNSLEISSEKLALALKYFCQFGLAILVAAAGFVVYVLRSRRREKIRRKYAENSEEKK